MFAAIRFTGKLMKRRPLRTLLTILEIALGTWILIIVLTMDFQGRDQLLQTRRLYGNHLASIYLTSPEQYRDQGSGMMAISEAIAYDSSLEAFDYMFRMEDLALLRENSLHIDSVYTESSNWQGVVQFGQQEYYVNTVMGTTEDYAEAVNLRIIQGQFFLEEDVKVQNRVMVISETMAKSLFGDRSPVGEKLRMRNSYSDEVFEYDIIGVFAPFTNVQTMILYNEPHAIVPLGTQNFTSYPIEERFYQVVIRSDNIHAAVEEARVLMKQKYGDNVEIEADYFSNRTESLGYTIRTLTMFFGAFAFVAVVVSAIGILSIMLVSVVERTKEIGLRRCLGATKGSIALWILTESCLLTLLGSLLGLLAAALSSNYVVGDLIGGVLYGGLFFTGGMHPLAAVVSVGIMLLAGVIFGLYPAVQAARLAPVEALKEYV